MATNQKLLLEVKSKLKTGNQAELNNKMKTILKNAQKNFDDYTSTYEPDEKHVEKMTNEVEEIDKTFKQIQMPYQENAKALNQLKKMMGM